MQTFLSTPKTIFHYIYMGEWPLNAYPPFKHLIIYIIIYYNAEWNMSI